MKVEQKKSGPCTVLVTVNADAEEIKEACKSVLNAFAREGVIPGFRKGKVPMEVIKQKFSKEIDQETKQRVVQSLYPKALEQEKIEPFATDGVTEVTVDAAKGATFTVQIEVKPEFKLPKYKKLAIKKNDVVVTDEQVKERVENYRKAFAKYDEAAEDYAAADGDYVQFDYTGKCGKQEIAELVPDQKVVSGQQGFWTQIEEGRFLPQILEALKGMKKGEEKKGVKFTFPKDAAPDPLKGKKVSYDLTVKSIRKQVLPDDAEFAKNAKAESFEKLVAEQRASLEEAAANGEKENQRNQAIDLLLKKADFDVPPAVVNQQMQANLERFVQQAQYAGLPSDYFEKNREKILKDAEESAQKQVRLSYILGGIADAEKIEVTEAEEKDENKRAAMRSGKALDFVLAEAK